MRNKSSLVSFLAAFVLPFRLYAVEPAKEPTFAEKLSAWLTEKEKLAADLKAANARADAAEATCTTDCAALQTKLTKAETDLAAANEAKATAEGKATQAEAARASAASQVEAFTALFASIGFKPAAVTGKEGAAATAEEIAAAFQASFTAHVSGAVTQKVQEIGFPAAKLPSASKDADAGSTYEEIQAKLATCTDAAEAGRLAQQANKLRNAQWAAGKN